MASIFSLYGEIFIDKEKAVKSLDDVKKKGEDTGKNFSKKFGEIASTVGKVGAAVVTAGTTIVTGLSAMVMGVADASGAIDDSAKKVGTTAEEYQKWAYAAKLGGMETSNLEKLMIKQQKAFSDAKEGSTSLTEAYSRLGININEIGSSGEAFNEVINSLADMEDATTRNALANDIFGKSYADLAPLLAEGSDGIARWRQECEDLGGVLSSKAVEAGADFGDVVDRIKTALGGMYNNIISQLIPILQKVLQMVLDNLPTIQNMVTSIAPVILNLFTSLLPPLIKLIQAILPVFVNLLNQLLPFITKLTETVLPIFIKLINLILPPLLKIIESILPLLINLLSPLLPILQPLLDLLQPFIDLLTSLISPLLEILNYILTPITKLLSRLTNLILPPLQTALEITSGIITSVLGGALNLIKNQISLVIDSFKNIIDFIKNVFTGNWKDAWENVKNIFKNIATSLGNIFKAPINFIIDLLNSFIKGLNKIKIPKWVPGGGGKGINIPLIKKLRVGMEYVPYDEMPAILHKGEAVLKKEDAEKYRNSEKQNPINQTTNYNNTIIVEKLEVKDEKDIERIAEELYYLQKKKVGA